MPSKGSHRRRERAPSWGRLLHQRFGPTGPLTSTRPAYSPRLPPRSRHPRYPQSSVRPVLPLLLRVPAWQTGAPGPLPTQNFSGNARMPTSRLSPPSSERFHELRWEYVDQGYRPCMVHWDQCAGSQPHGNGTRGPPPCFALNFSQGALVQVQNAPCLLLDGAGLV